MGLSEWVVIWPVGDKEGRLMCMPEGIGNGGLGMCFSIHLL